MTGANGSPINPADGLPQQPPPPPQSPTGGEEAQPPQPGDDRPQFQSNLRLLLTCLGCAVGTGNIWRFPRIVANNSKKGGLVFLIVWFMFLFLWSIPMLVVEFGLGRYKRKAVVGSIRELFSDKVAFLGLWIVMVAFFISCYYAVILGWCFYYTFYCIIEGLPDSPHESRQIFTDFAQDHRWLPVITTFSAIFLAGVSVAKGVKTIERVSSILVPCLLTIIAVCFFGSLFLPYSGEGIKFLFTPDWDSFLHIPTWIDAISQNAFDTGAGSGLMLTFASYMSARHGIVRYATVIPLMNNFVSLICAMTIFGGMFSVMITQYGYITQEDIVETIQDSGPGNTGLTFIWLPVLFNTFGDGLGQAVAFFFFLCLSFAGLTSLISYMELFALTLTDFGIPRKLAIPACTMALFCVSLMSALNIRILNNQDFVWGFALVVNGLILVGVVIAFGPSRFRDDVINNFTYIGIDWTLPKFWKWFAIGVIPLEGACVLIWWAADLIADPVDSDHDWDDLGEQTFLTTIIEWAGVFFVVFLINMIVYYCRRHFASTNDEYSRLFDHRSGGASENQNGHLRSYDSGTGSVTTNQTTEFANILSGEQHLD